MADNKHFTGNLLCLYINMTTDMLFTEIQRGKIKSFIGGKYSGGLAPVLIR